MGLKAVLIFAVDTVNPRDETGTHATDLACKTLQILRNHFKEKLLLCADVCLCTSTNHGHCGVFYKITPSNHAPEKLRDLEKTNQRLSEIALAYAKAGAHVIAPSDMQDGRIQAIKEILRENNLETNVAVLSYSAKFASCFYGPFRNACGSAPKTSTSDLPYPVDRQTYQLPIGAKNLAIRASERDKVEGADFLMVKPGMMYLDVIAELKKEFPYHPIAVYQVSGEYALIKASENQGFGFKQLLNESLVAFQRAGASIVISYFTPDILKFRQEGDFF